MPLADNYQANADVRAVRHLVAEVEERRAALALAFDRRDAALRNLRREYPEIGPAQLARLLGLTSSTVRASTRGVVSRG
jgi:hypothetical protein